MSISRDTVVTHPRFGFTITASDSGLPKLDGASCAGIHGDLWFYSNRDENELLRESPVDSGIGIANAYTPLHNTLARICAECPVLAECFNYALHHEEHGFWGGTSAREREVLRDKHQIGYNEMFDSDHVDFLILQMRELLEEEEEVDEDYIYETT